MNPHIQGYSYSECRLLGHAWHTVPSDWTPAFGQPMTVRCERCNMERRDSCSTTTGEVLARRYVYADGYRFQRDEDDAPLPRRDDFRLAWLQDEVAKQRRNRRGRRTA